MATNRPNPPKGATNIKDVQIAEPTGFLPGFTFLGPGKGASAAIGDYLEEKLPEETIGSQALKFIAKGIGSGIGEGLDFVAEPFVGLDKLLGLPAIGSGKEIEDIKKSQLKLAPQARQQDPSGDMGFGIISPDIFDPKFAPKDKKFAPTFPSEGLTKDLSKKTGRATLESDGVATQTDATDTTGKADETSAVSEQDNLDELFSSALQSAADAREGKPTKRKTLEDYKKEFSEATGIDASGKVDKSGALMALGLALMQNKAGKGFNVGNMLSAVGEAGSKALPVFEKAKQQAKLAAAKAGEYALGKVAEDDAKAKLEQEEMLNREQYYVVPKGEKGGPMGVVNSVLSGDGEFVRVNKFELAKLDENQEFNDKFEIVKASEYNDILKEAMKTPEAKENWSGKIQKMEFFKGHDYELSYYAPKSPDLGLKPMLVNPGVALNELTRLEQGLQQSRGRFEELANLISATDVTAPAQVRKTVVQISRNLGVPLSSETDPVKQIEVLLKEISALSAAEILGETGKTLSDSDRLRVDDIVGTLSFSEADPQVLITKLDRLFDVVVRNRERDITQFKNNLQTFGNPELRSYFQQGQSQSGDLVKGEDDIYEIK